MLIQKKAEDVEENQTGRFVYTTDLAVSPYKIQKKGNCDDTIVCFQFLTVFRKNYLGKKGNTSDVDSSNDELQGGGEI